MYFVKCSFLFFKDEVYKVAQKRWKLQLDLDLIHDLGFFTCIMVANKKGHTKLRVESSPVLMTNRRGNHWNVQLPERYLIKQYLHKDKHMPNFQQHVVLTYERG